MGIIIPTDFHIFQRGRYTTNQIIWHMKFARSDGEDVRAELKPTQTRCQKKMSHELTRRKRQNECQLKHDIMPI